MTNSKPGLLMLAPQSPVIGHSAHGPIFRAAGGRGGGSIDFVVGDDDGDDPSFDDEDDEDEDDDRSAGRWRDERDDDAGRDDWQPLSREAQEAMETALQRANREAMNRRKVGKVMDRYGITDAASFDDFLRSRGIDPDTGDRSDDTYDSGDDELTATQQQANDANTRKAATVSKTQYEREKLRAEQRGAAKAEAKYRDATTLLAAESALRGAGWSGKDINLALKLIDPDQVEISMDSGELTIDGLDEQVAAIRDEFPAWFAPTSRDRNPNRRRETAGARGVDGGNRERAPARRVGWKESISRQIDRGH